MRSAVEFCICGIALFVAVVSGLYLAIAMGFGESIWEPLACMAVSIGAMGVIGLLRTDEELDQRLHSASAEPESPA